jgi:hypothetical protein
MTNSNAAKKTNVIKSKKENTVTPNHTIEKKKQAVIEPKKSVEIEGAFRPFF